MGKAGGCGIERSEMISGQRVSKPSARQDSAADTASPYIASKHPMHLAVLQEHRLHYSPNTAR